MGKNHFAQEQNNGSVTLPQQHVECSSERLSNAYEEEQFRVGPSDYGGEARRVLNRQLMLRSLCILNTRTYRKSGPDGEVSGITCSQKSGSKPFSARWPDKGQTKRATIR